MRVADDALLVDDHRGGPRPVAVAPPDREIIVLHDRVRHAQLAGCGHHPVVGLLPEELRRVDPHDGQPLLLVLRVPVPQLRDHVLAVVSAIRPEFHEDHAPAQPAERQGRAIDPRAARDLGRGLSDAYPPLGARGVRQGDEPHHGQGEAQGHCHPRCHVRLPVRSKLRASQRKHGANCPSAAESSSHEPARVSPPCEMSAYNGHRRSGTGGHGPSSKHARAPGAQATGRTARMSDDRKLAMFIDFENIVRGVKEAQYKAFEIRLVLERLVEKGKIMVKRAYADWNRYAEYKRPFHEHAIELIDVPQSRYSGKNSADIRMVVDALDLAYAKQHVDIFALQRENKDTLWGSMVKQTMIRKNPAFNETYYGYSTFSKLLEEAEKQKIVTLERDAKSGTYIICL